MISDFYTVLGNDARQTYLASYLRTAGYSIYDHTNLHTTLKTDTSNTQSYQNALTCSAVIFCPIPFIRLPAEDLTCLQKCLHKGQTIVSGAIPDSFSKWCRTRQIMVLDVMENSQWVQWNSLLTAEGLLGTIIQNTPFSLTTARILLLGYGNCGKAIGTLLSALSSDIYIYDCSADAQETAKAAHLHTLTAQALSEHPQQWNLVINTVPTTILETSLLTQFSQDCIFFDIASAPGGFNPSVMKNLQLTLFQCPGIPGKSAPKTAGYQLAQLVFHHFNKKGDLL